MSRALIQGGLIRRLVPKYGEARLILIGLAIVALGYAAMAGVSGVATLVGAIALAGIGQGLASPSIQGLLSRSTPSAEQGAIFGTLTAAQTLARTLNYPASNILLQRYGPLPLLGGRRHRGRHPRDRVRRAPADPPAREAASVAAEASASSRVILAAPVLSFVGAGVPPASVPIMK